MRLGAVALTSAAVLGAGVATAGASTPASLSTVQAEAAAAITLRVNDLNNAIGEVNRAKNLGSEAATLAAYLGNDIAPLQQLGQTIATDSSVTTAQADYANIFTNFRLLVLVLPSARLASATAVIDNATLPNLTADSGTAAGHVNPSNAATLDPLITDLNNQISSATNSTSGLAATLLGYTPAQWNSNHNLLQTSRSSLQSAQGAVKAARNDLRQIRNDLRAAHAANTTPSTT
jgi:hypothetical protein